MKALGLAGTLRGLEVTHSFENGWHVHFHVLLFFHAPFGGLQALEEALFHSWCSCCVSCGLGAPSRQHGLKLDDGSYAEKYVTKWGMEAEITKSHIKKGREGHFTPFDFLRLYTDGDLRYADLFREYTEVFKGKNQLSPSPGLRGLLGLGKEKSDEDIESEEIEKAALFAEIPLNVWRVILSKTREKKNRSLIGKILVDICPQGKGALHDFIIDLYEEHELATT
jgi:hypothetical protein